jgi:flavin-dependent dehydrogenase
MIVVVGAGPCGLFVASRLHDLGHDVLVLSSSQKIFSFKTLSIINYNF